MHLEGFSCVYNAPVRQQPAPQPDQPMQWNKFAAAVAWGDSDSGAQFVGAEKHFDEQSAIDAALIKCRAKGWRNCMAATSIVNGVILVARDSERSLRTRIDANEKEGRRGLAEKCKADGVTCKILAVFDGRPEYF